MKTFFLIIFLLGNLLVQAQRVEFLLEKTGSSAKEIFLTDRQGLTVAGDHNDLYKIEVSIKKILAILEAANINTEGLFINADADFDGQKLHEFFSACDIIGNIVENKKE